MPRFPHRRVLAHRGLAGWCGGGGKAQKGADPWIEYYDGNYYLVTTSWTSVLTMRKSPTLAGLATAPSVRVWAADQASRCCNYWAPELHPATSATYLYFSGGPTGTDYVNKLFAPGNDVGLIDGSVLELNGQRYLLGSVWGSTTPTLSWERQDGTVNEGPEPLYHNGKTFIVYSASACWGPNYKMGLLTYNGGNPLSASAWTKASQPMFQRNGSGGVYGPGHNGFFTSPDGTEDWIVYHANDAAGDGCDNNRTTGTADGAATQTSTCTGANTQRWRFEDLGDDLSRLVNVNSGKVLDVANCGPIATPTAVRQWTWLNNNCQQWRLQPA